jgi:hypothetical protein
MIRLLYSTRQSVEYVDYYDNQLMLERIFDLIIMRIKSHKNNSHQ